MNQATSEVPRVLLVEDDPVSSAFLCEAITSFPAHVDVATTLAEARTLARTEQHELLLVDAHLPDGSGADLLDALRSLGIMTPAMAHTAELHAVLRETLLARGFVEVLPKPLGVAALHAALARHFRPTIHADWDDAAALSALGGDESNVQALRGLFLLELPSQQQRIRAAFQAGDGTALRAELHRLTASCGFVGATRLACAVAALQSATGNAGALAEVERAIDALLDATPG